MIRNSRFVGVMCLAAVLGGCSSSVQQPLVSTASAPGSAPGQVVPGAVAHGPHAGPHAGQHPNSISRPAPVAVTHCESFTGSYQMNMDSFTLTQEGCEKLTWTYAPQMTFDDNDVPVRDAHGSLVLTPERKIVWQLNGEERDGERSYFIQDGKRLIVEKKDGTTDIYFVASEGICDLYNPQGSYLVMESFAESFAAGEMGLSNRTACRFWSRN